MCRNSSRALREKDADKARARLAEAVTAWSQFTETFQPLIDDFSRAHELFGTAPRAITQLERNATAARERLDLLQSLADGTTPLTSIPTVET